MIVGKCPYECGEGFFLPVEGGPVPRVAVHNCERCSQTVYTYVSRIDPKSWTDENFQKKFPEAGSDKMPLHKPGECDA